MIDERPRLPRSGINQWQAVDAGARVTFYPQTGRLDIHSLNPYVRKRLCAFVCACALECAIVASRVCERTCATIANLPRPPRGTPLSHRLTDSLLHTRGRPIGGSVPLRAARTAETDQPPPPPKTPLTPPSKRGEKAGTCRAGAEPEGTSCRRTREEEENERGGEDECSRSMQDFHTFSFFSFSPLVRQPGLKGSGSYLIHPGAKGQKRKINATPNGETIWRTMDKEIRPKPKGEGIFRQDKS